MYTAFSLVGFASFVFCYSHLYSCYEAFFMGMIFCHKISFLPTSFFLNVSFLLLLFISFQLCVYCFIIVFFFERHTYCSLLVSLSLLVFCSSTLLLLKMYSIIFLFWLIFAISPLHSSTFGMKVSLSSFFLKEVAVCTISNMFTTSTCGVVWKLYCQFSISSSNLTCL